MKDTEKKKVMDALDSFVDKVLAYDPKKSRKTKPAQKDRKKNEKG